MFWGRVETLIIEHDDMMNSRIIEFVGYYGRNLSELTILGEVNIMDFFFNYLEMSNLYFFIVCTSNEVKSSNSVISKQHFM